MYECMFRKRNQNLKKKIKLSNLRVTFNSYLGIIGTVMLMSSQLL